MKKYSILLLALCVAAVSCVSEADLSAPETLEDKLKLCELFEKIEAHNKAVTSLCDELREKDFQGAAEIADRILSSLSLLNGKQKDI